MLPCDATQAIGISTISCMSVCLSVTTLRPDHIARVPVYALWDPQHHGSTPRENPKILAGIATPCVCSIEVKAVFMRARIICESVKRRKCESDNI